MCKRLARVCVALLSAGIAVGTAASPVCAAIQPFFTDSGGTYSCGSPAMGMRGVLRLSGSPTCTTSGTLTIPAFPVSATIATFYTPAVLSTSRAVPVRGTSLNADIMATTPGPMTVEMGYGPNTGSFTSLGYVEIAISNQRIPLGGVSIDLGQIWGMVPANNYLALRLTKRDSGLEGSIRFRNALLGGNSSIRGVLVVGAWKVPGDFATIQSAINNTSVLSGDRVYLMPDTYSTDGFKNVAFNGKSVTVVGEGGAAAVVIDCGYSGYGFRFDSGETSSAGLEGLTIARASLSAVRVGGGASPVIRDCVIRDSENTNPGEGGGGVSLDVSGAGAAPLIERTSFLNNRAENGGALAISGGGAGNVTIRACSFRGNAATSSGGGISFLSAVASATISASFFEENVAAAGGAILEFYGATISVTGSTFVRNVAREGGAVYSRLTTLSNNVFTENRGLRRGGAILTDNPASDTRWTVLNHSTLTGNRAGTGGAIYMSNNSKVTVANSILWGNSHQATAAGKEISAGTGTTANLFYVNIEGGLAEGLSSPNPTVARPTAGLMNQDPLFAFPSAPYLMPDSPCRDAGTASFTLPPGTPSLPTKDKDGVARALTACAAGTPDLGAYEYHGDCGFPVPVLDTSHVVLTARQGGPPPDVVALAVRNAAETALSWVVSEEIPWLQVRPPAQGETTDDTDTVALLVSTSGLDPGEYRGTVSLSAATPPKYEADWPRAVEVLLRVTTTREVCLPAGTCEYDSIQAAIDAAGEGDEVLVGDGTWRDAGNKNLTLRNKQLTIRSRNGRDATVIDCENSGRGFLIRSGQMRTSVIEGFTVTRGNPSDHRGGGLWAGEMTSVQISGCTFDNNDLGVAVGSIGGGAYILGGAVISNCIFQGNDADSGGGLYARTNYEGLLITDSAFLGNTGSLGAGAIVEPPSSTTSSSVLRACRFEGNSHGARATNSGAGVYLNGPNVWLDACRFVNNTALGGYGGGVYSNSGAGTRISNCVVRSNYATNGSGAFLQGSGEVVNSTFVYNGNIDTALGGGIYNNNQAGMLVRNCIVAENFANGTGTGDDFYPLNSSSVSYSHIGDLGDVEWGSPTNHNQVNVDPLFISGSDDRLLAASPCIDNGTSVNWLFSDNRGSVRAVDGGDGRGGLPDGVSKFDMGAYEYSRFYGGIGEDQTAKAFRDLSINGSIVATGYEYRVQWKTKDPFPSQMDERVEQAGEYEVRLLLVNAAGRRLELGTWVLRLGPQYTVPYTFRAEHIGDWRLRLEMVSDPNQFTFSEPISIQYKDLVTYYLGREIPPPAGAILAQRPDVDYPDAVYWSTETNRLYAIAPFPVQLIWYGDKDRTIPLLVMGIIQTPPDPVFHVADGPPVELRPEGTRFGAVNILWSDSSATIASDRFTAPQDGWTTLLFRDAVNPQPELREYFTVVRTLTWNHQGVDPPQDPFYPPPPPDPPPLPPVDPIYPIEKPWEIGAKVIDDEHDQSACGGGHVLNEVAPYDGAGDDRAYDRPTRSGQIFAVNEDDPRTEEDDLVVIWYRRQGSVEEGAPGVCWPFKPVRYDPFWPAPGNVCPVAEGQTCNRIEISGKLQDPADPKSRVPNGSGALTPDLYGAWDNMSVYNQPDRSLPGFNPNEEHAMLFVSEGTPYPGAFPLRYDLNNNVWNSPPFSKTTPASTSPPAVLVKYRNPDSGEWGFRVFLVEKGVLTYYPEAGNEFNPPYPLNQFVFGPCRDFLPAGEDPASPDSPHTGTWTDAVLYEADGSNMSTAEALLDKDKKIFSIRGSRPDLGEAPVLVRTYQFYRLQPGFWFDRDYNGWPDKPAGTCIPLLDGIDGDEDGYTPAPITYDIQWPETPTLYVGETLADSKMQAGETVGLPNIKDQCIVAKLWDEAGVRLFDPLKAFKYPDPAAPFNDDPAALPVGELRDKDGTPLKTDPPTPVGSRVIFRDLPPQLQQRLTYDAVTEQLKLKGEYITTTGEPVLMLNTLSIRERAGVKAALNLAEGSGLLNAIDVLRARGNANLAGPAGRGKPSLARWEADFKAVSAGRVNDTGYVTLAFNNHEDCPAPTVLNVIEVDCPLYRGDLKVVESPNPFEEKLTLRHNGDFGGKPDDRYFQWVYLQGFSGIPEGPGTEGENWLPFNKDNSAPGPTAPEPGWPVTKDVAVPDEGTFTFARGLVDITPLGTGQQLLPDRWFAVRYYYGDPLNYHTDPPVTGPVCSMVSPWTPPQLAEGWVKRVMKKINLFDQRVKDFHKTDPDSLASMIAQAGREYEGDVALSDEPEYLKRVGLIELYQTLLNRALRLSLDADPVDPNLRDAVLFAANRLASLYMLLGNEAYADSADPTIGFGTQDGQYGAAAPSIFAFQNQMDTLLDEEFALLAGRSNDGMRPYYNRVPWNFTIADGEVAYRQVYNITDVADVTGAMEPDGEINEYDAKFLFPQGHGDAWGHYLSAIKRLYYIVTHDASSLWAPTVEAILVAQAPVEVDYRDERLFATAAAARARTGVDLVNLAYRRSYDEDPERQWLGYRDSNPTRAWGLAEWASRAGQGAYIDWAVGNALLPPVSTEIRKTETYPAPESGRVAARYVLGADYARGELEITVDDVIQPICTEVDTTDCWKVALVEDPVKGWSRTQVDVLFNPLPAVTAEVKFRVSLPAEGIKKVDRTTVVELHEITAQYTAIQSVLDQADRGLNPLGVAKDTVPFDIDPALVATGQTHFEQIYNRALQTLQNAVTVFDYANQSSQMLRRQQDRLDDFKRTIEDREADYTSRLVEVFGYPYPEDCGPGKLYPTGYCETGPDLYHYMYVEPSHLMGEANPDKRATTAPRELRYTVTFKDLGVDDTGALTETEVPVDFTVDEDRRFGIIKPSAWTGNRRAPGALQLARADLLQLQGRFERAIIEYETLLGQVEDQAQLITDQFDLNANEISYLQVANGKQVDLNTSILNGRKAAEENRADAEDAVLVANIAMEAIPKVIGLATDGMSALRGIALGIGQGISQMLMRQATQSSTGELSSQQAKEVAGAEANVDITTARGDFAVKQQILQLENLVRREAVLRQELYTLVEGLQQSAGRFLNALASGERILEERLRFRKQTAAQVQDYRYTDMTFRVFRNDALQKYKAQLDLAARYAYLAAKAYDYETTLLDSSSMAGRAFLTGIVKERSIGTVLGGQPLTGTGIADVLRRLSLNFQVLKPQLGFNNPQVETNRFSLRRELFRVRFDSGSDETWRNALETFRVEDLWGVPEFKRYCRPFAAEGVAQPGLVIPFRTTVTSGLNFFGWPLGGGDSYYSAANFATKIRSVGVWFSNYNATGLAQTPRVYLVPAGEDVLRSPTGGAGDIRSWHVLDQKLPVPQFVNAAEMAGDPEWIPAVDTILDEFGAPRRHADFKAYHDSGYLEPTELTYDTRLIGRSVWNTKWMLIIPGRNLLYDPDEGLDMFIEGPEVFGGTGDRSGKGISDIKLFFTTYAYSGY